MVIISKFNYLYNHLFQNMDRLRNKIKSAFYQKAACQYFLNPIFVPKLVLSEHASFDLKEACFIVLYVIKLCSLFYVQQPMCFYLMLQMVIE